MPSKRQTIKPEARLPIAIIVTTVGKTYIGEFGDQPNDRWVVLTNGRLVLDDESLDVVDPIEHLTQAAVKGPIAPLALSELPVEALSIPYAVVQLMISCNAEIWAPWLRKTWKPRAPVLKSQAVRESVVDEWLKPPA